MLQAIPPREKPVRPVYEADSLIDAHLVRGLLEAEGIPAWVRGESLAGAMGELPVAGLVVVCVPEACLPAARDALSPWIEAEPGADGAALPGTLAPLLA